MQEVLVHLVYPFAVGVMLMLVRYCIKALRWRQARREELAEAEATGKLLVIAAAVSGIALIWVLNKKTASMSHL